MRDTLGNSLTNLKWLRKLKIRMSVALMVLSLVVSFDVFYALRQPGLTLAGDASCGIVEHKHDEDCYEQDYVCELIYEPHEHNEACFEMRHVEAQEISYLSCTLGEIPHQHNDNCYITVQTAPLFDSILICENADEEHDHDGTCYETIESPGVEERILNCQLVFEPHEHSEACYSLEIVEAHDEEVQICTPEEIEHIHNDSCYGQKLCCESEEHSHSVDCYSDNTADVETMLDWQNMFAAYPYTDDFRTDLVGIARTQLGYTESELNFEQDEDGIRRGYTRYGAWYGVPYGDWSAMFVSFCLSYAGADPNDLPSNIGANSMARLWQSFGKFAELGEYSPIAGDLAFFHDNTVGIVAEIHTGCFDVIRGDVDGEVCLEMLSLTDESISGWGITEGTLPEKEEEPAAEKQQSILPITKEMLDISQGPAFFIYQGGEVLSETMAYSLRYSRSITDLMPYLEAQDGSYFFTLLDFNNKELPKDADGNYIAVANDGYKLTLTFNAPNGFLPGTYQYQIPNGLMVDGGEGTFILNDGVEVGNWVVTDTGLITLYFNEHMNSRTDITISSTLGIHFPEQEDPIDFDGFISVKVEPPVQQANPTKISKWGSPNTATGKINWTVYIVGNLDSQIVGNILTDQALLNSWDKPHSYTESDIAAGISFGASDPNGNWHNWTVYADDPHLVWNETSWSYKVPKTVNCIYCGELELGDNGWEYYVNYSSTPTDLNTPGTFDYENKASIDGQNAWGWSNFTHGSIEATISKTGSFQADTNGGAFLWEFQATIPGRPEGKKAEYSWFIMDEMRLLNETGSIIGYVHNDSNLSIVTATYNGTTIRVPRIQDATDADMFAWDNSWSSTDNGINSTRTLNLLCRCQCTEETCHWSGCSEYWYQKDDGSWATNGFCQCWTETQNMTFTFVYKTTDLSMIEGYGTLGYQLNNHAQLYYIPGDSVRVSYDDATVPIPNLFQKQLTHDFDGYTANYKVTVNEAKIVLTDGSPLYIHDEMTPTLAYISGSLVITAEDANGNTYTLKQGEDFTVAYDGSGKQKDDTGNTVHVLDIVILHPQPVMYTLDYDTTLIMPEQVTGAIKYSNSANITLWGESIKDSATEKVYADINIAAKNYSVKMFKNCASTGKPLEGATFGLFNENGGLISSATTNIHGELLFQSNITQGIILREHILYYMQELQAPPGYQLDDRNYWFCFCDHTGDSCETCEQVLNGLDATRIPFEQLGKIHISNELMKYELPATGGPGIYPLIWAGAILIITPLVYRSVPRRKQEGRFVN